MNNSLPPVLPRRCNEMLDNLNEERLESMKTAIAANISELLDLLGIDHNNDHNTRGTPCRVAKMLVEEILVGRYSEPPQITEFENPLRFDQLITTGPIEVRSTCAHHLLPIYGSAYIGIIPAPDGKLIGLSKYDRIVHYFSARLQIQEELVTQIGQFISEKTNPRGIAVRISAVHMCKTHRGVRSNHSGRMISSYYDGTILNDDSLRSQFQQECSMLEGLNRGF